MAILIRRRSKKQQALRAARKTGTRLAKARVAVAIVRALRSGAGTAAKGGLVVATLAKARKAVAAGVGAGVLAAVLALVLRRRGSSAADTGTEPTPSEAPMPAPSGTGATPESNGPAAIEVPPSPTP
jgi:hypothetical protein